MITRIYTTKQVVLDYDDSVPSITATFLEFLLEGEFVLALDFGLDFIKEIKETRKILWLSDTTLSPVFNEADPKWAAENWTPRAQEVGIGHVAFIQPEEELALISVNDYTEDANKKGMVIAYFKDAESAKKWFKEQV
jgi:hypothetical protein